VIKPLIAASLLGATAGVSSLTTTHLVHTFGDTEARFEMQVLQDQTVVTLDKRTGDVRYIYQHGKDTPPAQYAIDVKAGSSYGQVVPPERRTH
jgi:hypothetical protein